ncbi:pantoate--beta-alanine ligase [Aestuariivirga sp. YIM B02566]|uniref:Pantoate--beta-alanine ligase n=1 Tax=Taklimakanibacter albus TaxID=2800327 RepID=A0ACC5R241_9HYPH|nr:pantoate--beta-alanine ligase [Aestuariivirga sp. YIM B02566]MBK1866716.1 pantoate--beta-alanine ligase [Aestuariivirga sp. YIM B02566]
MTLNIVRNILDLRKETAGWRAEGLTYAVVPTMGALHQGHITLVKEGLKHADRVLTTIFVNPKQFAAHEDLGRYPRTEAADVAMLAEAGAHLVFAPAPEDIYPPGFATSVVMAGPAKVGLEDKYRPQFFDGVATVVAKLFTQSGADFAMFGEKDYQQLMVVTRMARDLDLPIKVIGVPTVREESGLALSSRNAYLSKTEHHQAAGLHQRLVNAARKINAGQKPSRATAAARRSLALLGFKVDYVAARNAETLALPKSPDEPLRLLAAAWLGTTRLIDNIAV